MPVRHPLRYFLFATALPLATPLLAQDAGPGRVSTSSVGEAGQRQTREQGIPGAEPLSRVSSRVQNRVESRIRNRIDRYYDPLASARSPFAIAGDQARVAGRTGRR